MNRKCDVERALASLENRAPNADARAGYATARGEFGSRRMRSCADLVANYSALSAASRFVAILVFRDCKCRKATALLFREIHHSDPKIAGIAGVALGYIGGNDVFARVLRHWNKEPQEARRQALLNVLCHLQNVDDKARLVATLSQVIEHKGNGWGLRTCAVSGVRDVLAEANHRLAWVRRAISMLESLLDDDNSDVRCASANALGFLGVRSALDKLRLLAATDHAHCSGSFPNSPTWTVSKEATEAISAIQDEENS